MCSGTISDQGTISPITGGGSTSITPTLSLSLSSPNMTSNAVSAGSVATASTNVSVSVANAESYALMLSVDNTNLTSGSTTLTAGNATTDNTWGYKWDTETSYTAPSTSGKNLTVPALTNNSVDFTKTLTFGAKFSTSAEAGHYRGSGTLSLVATPKKVSLTLADLTQMQQLTLAPEACSNTPYLAGQNYSAEYTLTDVRDGNTYTVRKFGDGKCWMTSNLRLWNKNSNNSMYYTGGRVLKPETSDISTSWTLPASSLSGFSDNAASDVYVSGDTGYYTWCAATAGTCSSATSNGTNVTSSICPKGWTLPTGGTSGNTDFYNLFKHMDLTISGSLNTGINTSWGTGDLDKVQGSPYNFAYTGYILDGSLINADSQGFWRSRTSGSSSHAYVLYIGSSNLGSGTTNNLRYNGYAIRCVAQ